MWTFSVPTVVAAMLSIQSGAALAKSLFHALGPEGTTAFRIGVSAVILFAAWRPRWPGRAAWRLILPYGLALGAMNLTFYYALARIPLGAAVAVEFSGPLAVALADSRRPRDVLWVVLAVMGILMLLPIGTDLLGGGLDPVGIGFALAAGLFWALYIVFGQRAGRALPTGTVTALGMSVAALAVLPVALVTRGTALYQPAVFPAAFGVALLSSAIPYTLEMIAMRRMPARQFGLLMSLEPVLATCSGLVFLNERLGPAQMLAIGAIVTAVVGATWSNRE